MHTSADVRLSTQVSQLTNRYRGLLTLIKDLISKWEGYVHDHQTFDSRHGEFRAWLGAAEEKLDSCQQPGADQDSMEEKKALVQVSWCSGCLSIQPYRREISVRTNDIIKVSGRQMKEQIISLIKNGVKICQTK